MNSAADANHGSNALHALMIDIGKKARAASVSLAQSSSEKKYSANLINFDFDFFLLISFA